ncbi:DUF2670 domain-containing protein [Bradyrhizobium centrosematis]|uniref:DUF2670 domain-containing protein n=1 Tax=Bradyrhizobium centrosematis TaxID=1300039 RepID=UPI00216A8833|nr:DUF2670 domain-containing protein [Bradyrhizobium centrosematis]MCS3762093.1 hypothetical protein [Bradyrhizobium centrosematis]MCS3774762.1 hypothetical protein [Bradyrhizobium centrosematis]
MKEKICEALDHIFRGIGILQTEFANRRFTIDGRLVGDIGEIIAAAEFDVALDEIGRAGHDGHTSDRRLVQIKATFKEKLTFGRTPELYLGFKLYPNGSHDVIFNGPGEVIFNEYRHRQGIGARLLSFPISRLRELSATVADKDRVPSRTE